MIVLGIETSCDETAAALVSMAADGAPDRNGDPVPLILADRILSQLDDHRPYGGVVPEIAARAHLDHLDGLVAGLFDDAGLRPDAIHGVAATAGPGLIGGLVVGLTYAKGFALAAAKPFVAINHLEAHALSVRLSHPEVGFPYLLLLVSGGHCQLVSVEGLGRYRLLGATLDDAAGEAFDKAAKMMGLSYPGGPALERAARSGDKTRFSLPRPLMQRAGCDFSFAGLKTALRDAVLKLKADRNGCVADADIADLAASFQAAVADVLEDRTAHGLDAFVRRFPSLGDGQRHLVVAGGVASNALIRHNLTLLGGRRGFVFVAPPPRHCTDNAAMVAWAGIERLRAGLSSPFSAPARPRWPLEDLNETAPVIG